MDQNTTKYTYFMTVVLGPTWAYEERDKLVTLQWSGTLFHSRHCGCIPMGQPAANR